MKLTPSHNIHYEQREVKGQAQIGMYRVLGGSFLGQQQSMAALLQVQAPWSCKQDVLHSQGGEGAQAQDHIKLGVGHGG